MGPANTTGNVPDELAGLLEVLTGRLRAGH
jgi:hypothetical protein